MKFNAFTELKKLFFDLTSAVDIILESNLSADLNPSLTEEIPLKIEELFNHLAIIESEISENLFNADFAQIETYQDYYYLTLERYRDIMLKPFIVDKDYTFFDYFKDGNAMKFKDEYEKLFIGFDVLRELIITIYQSLGSVLSDVNHFVVFLPKLYNKVEPQQLGPQQYEKIKWNGSPSLIAFLFLELAKQGYIDIPSHKGEGSYAGYAKLVFKYFEIAGSKGNHTTVENLIKEFNPNKNTIGISTSSKFTIPPFQKK